jgi:isopentenyl-diphosphate delta-isomerase
MAEQVILVNEMDEAVGAEEKIKAHLAGSLHRAFSIFIFNSSGQLLLQKRSASKYHSKGLWSNTCCGHPRPGESLEDASRRRLLEEMGFVCEIRESFKFIYRAQLDGGFIEHECDHVFFGRFDSNPNPCKDEVGDWKWVNLTSLKFDMQENPENYTYWLKISLDALVAWLNRASAGARPRLKVSL